MRQLYDNTALMELAIKLTPGAKALPAFRVLSVAPNTGPDLGARIAHLERHTRQLNASNKEALGANLRLEQALADSEEEVERLSEYLKIALGRLGTKLKFSGQTILSRKRVSDRRNARYTGV